MPFDCFVQIDGIEGESTDDKHKNWIEVLSYGFGANQTAGSAASTGGSRAGGRVELSDFAITKVLDKASPKIFVGCCTGKSYDKVTVQVCRATGEKEVYMEYLLEDVLITNYNPSGSSSGSIPSESVMFNPAKITLTYTAFDHDTGVSAGSVTGNWSQEANKGS